MTSQTTIPVGMYWKPGVRALARSAYLADLDTDADSPGSFVGWLAQALRSTSSLQASPLTTFPSPAALCIVHRIVLIERNERPCSS